MGHGLSVFVFFLQQSHLIVGDGEADDAAERSRTGVANLFKV